MLSYFYSFFIFLYKQGFILYSLFDTKAKNRVQGLGSQSKELEQNLAQISSKRILVHCASLGEYEQIKPIINWIIDKTDFDIVVSFFSPSGYQDSELIDGRSVKCYLPFDLRTDISQFINVADPAKVIIAKNEWWWNLLHILKEKKLPTYLVSSTIRSDHYFIKHPYTFFEKGISAFDSIFVVNDDSKKHLNQFYRGRIITAGDTRKDRVLEIMQSQSTLTTNSETIVYGSIWKSDLHIIKEIIRLLPDYNHFIYPHDLGAYNISNLSKKLDCEIYDIAPNSVTRKTCIINSMGQLKKDYSLATIAYIGGGFGEGIHNILEAVVFGIPAIVGPKFHKSEEAKELVKKNIVFPLSEAWQTKHIIDNLKSIQHREEINLKLKAYFSASNSATEIICAEIFK